MLKLIKYEFIKKYRLFLIALAVAAIINIFAILKGSIAGSTIFLSVFPIVIAILYIVDVIKMYSEDLNKKSGYMLFMTPNSGYKIILSKVITAIIEGFGILLIYFIFIMLNGCYIVYETGIPINTSELISTINNILSGRIGFTLGHVFLILITALAFIINFILTVYTAITIRKSIFSEIKLGGFLSFIIFIGINWITSFTSSKFMSALSVISPYYNMDIDITQITVFDLGVMLIPIIGIIVVQSIILTIISGFLLEKKINL